MDTGRHGLVKLLFHPLRPPERHADSPRPYFPVLCRGLNERRHFTLS